MGITVAFTREFQDAEPSLEAEAVFDLEAAGDWHRSDNTFSLNTCRAYDIPGGRIAVPVDGSVPLSDLQALAKVRLTRIS